MPWKGRRYEWLKLLRSGKKICKAVRAILSSIKKTFQGQITTHWPGKLTARWGIPIYIFARNVIIRIIKLKKKRNSLGMPWKGQRYEWLI